MSLPRRRERCGFAPQKASAVRLNAMPVTLRSYSKINLGLAIGPVRPDGFHALATLYQTVAAHDLVTVSVTRTGGREAASTIAIACEDPRVPRDARNTVWTMLTQALGAPGRSGLHVEVEIRKRLPVQGGLGGGSGNAIAALAGLEHELARLGVGEPLSGASRLRMAAAVGSDVPLFLLGGAVLGLGRGEQVIPLSDLPAMPVVLALPQEGVSTPAAFRDWDREQLARGLTDAALAGRLEELSRALAAAWCEQHATGVFSSQVVSGGENLAGTLLSTLVQTGILLNDFEQVVFRQHPLLEQTKRALSGETSGKPALYAALSGSGSALFGIYRTDEAAEAAEERLNTLGIRSLRTRMAGRGTYWAGMVVDKE